jgi:general secretion pathway protein L
MGQKILGLDLGSYSIKGTLLERNWRDFAVLGYFERVNDADQALTPYQRMHYNLQKFLEEFPLDADTAVMAAMPADLIAYRILELPFNNQKKIDQAMEFELESYIPIELDKVWFDYHPLALEKGLSRVLCAYTQLEDFKQILQVCTQNKFDPRKVSGEPSDLALLSHVAMLPQEGQYALIDVGHVKTTLVIMNGRELRYIRTFLSGGHAMTQRIAAELHASEVEAERIKKNELKLSPQLDDTSPALAALHGVLREWLVSIRQTFAAYAQQKDGYRVEAVYLLGGGSRLSGLDKVLSSYLKVNVSSLDSLAFASHRIANATEVMPSLSPSFACALKSLNFPRQIEINLRKGDFAYRGDIEGLEQWVKRAAVWVIAVLGAGILHYQVSYYTMSGKVKAVREETQKLLGKDLGGIVKGKNFSLNTALAIVNGKKEELNKELALLQGERGTSDPLSVLQELSDKVPKGDEIKVDIDSLNITESLVRMDGKTTSFEAVDKIKQALAGSERFFDVKVDNVTKGLKDDVKFSLSLSLEKKS